MIISLLTYLLDPHTPMMPIENMTVNVGHFEYPEDTCKVTLIYENNATLTLCSMFSKQTSPQPRSLGICSWEAKTLVDSGHVNHRKLIVSEGDGKVSYYMFPLPHFTFRLQGVVVLYNNL
jgi:hypothetical protein